MVFSIFSLLLSCIDLRSDKDLKEKEFNRIHNFFKTEYNLILSKEDFDINMEVYYKPFSKGRAFLLKPKKSIEYKSKYFSENLGRKLETFMLLLSFFIEGNKKKLREGLKVIIYDGKMQSMMPFKV